jgi:hypothetical protein
MSIMIAPSAKNAVAGPKHTTISMMSSVRTHPRMLLSFLSRGDDIAVDKRQRA